VANVLAACFFPADWLSVAPEAEPDRLARRMQIAAREGRLPITYDRLLAACRLPHLPCFASETSETGH
jgi:hypothetical protein